MKFLPRSLYFAGALLLVMPTISTAADWERGQDSLEQHLQPGEAPAAYRKTLRDLGYTLTAINYSSPDYVEYEVVKDNESYEVQIDVNEDTGHATNIDITKNPGKTDRTQTVLEGTDQQASLNDPNYLLVITPILVEVVENRTGMERMVRDLEALPVGKNKQFYRSALQERGYRVFDTVSKGNRTQYGVERDGQRALLSFWFDQDSGNSTQVTAFPLLLNITPHASSPTADIARHFGVVQQMVQELESLPVGQQARFYRQALQEHGYRIIKTMMEANHTRFEAEKNGQEIVLSVNFDERTGKSTNVEANASKEQGQYSRQMSKSEYVSDSDQ